MSDTMIDLPQAESADPDGVQVALRAAQTLWSRGDTSESLRWLRRAAESASDEGADLRSLQLAKAAAELRALFAGSESASPSMTPPEANPALAEVNGLARQGAASVAVAPGVFPSTQSPSSDGSSARLDDASSGSLSALQPSALQPSVLQPSPSQPPPSRPPGATTQYVVHRPREAPRQLMGLSSSTLETAVQRDSSAYSAVPSWSADADRRISSAPPPLPRAAVEDYEELDAEPDEDSSEEVVPWSNPAPTWRGRSDSQSDAGSAALLNGSADAAARANTGAPSNPPPFPTAHVFGEDDEMRPEQPTVVIPPPEEARQPVQPDTSWRVSGTAARDAALSEPREAPSSWEADVRPPSWEGGSWDGENLSSGSSSLSEPAPPKLTARVHHQAVRVSVAADSRVSGQFILRPLREGERPLAGERVALLVALEPGSPLV